MRLNVNYELKNFAGAKLMRAENSPMLLKDAVIDCLMAQGKNENIAGDEKIERYAIALKINSADENTDFSAEEIVKIKKVVKNYAAVIVCGQLILEIEKGEKN